MQANPRSSWRHLLSPSNLSLALFNENPSIRFHGTMQSAGMMVAAFAFVYSLLAILRGITARGLEDQAEKDIKRSFSDAVSAAEKHASLLKPELTRKKQLTLFCIDGTKP